MHPPISPADLATLIDEAAVAARRLHRRLVLPAADLDDLRQDLLVDLICRLPGFDARRGSIGAFANIVLRNQSSRIAIRHHRQRRGIGRNPSAHGSLRQVTRDASLEPGPGQRLEVTIGHVVTPQVGYDRTIKAPVFPF